MPVAISDCPDPSSDKVRLMSVSEVVRVRCAVRAMMARDLARAGPGGPALAPGRCKFFTEVTETALIVSIGGRSSMGGEAVIKGGPSTRVDLIIAINDAFNRL